METVVSPESTQESRQPSALMRWLGGPWPIILFLFLAALILNSSHNDLPYYYEKDAPSKVRQVVSGDRNFFHPLLMLNTADVILTLSGAERTHQNAAIAGRTGIALCTAIGIAAFAMLAYRLEGKAAALLTGGLLITFPLLFELSHIFKEDPALIVGLGLAFLAMQMFWTKRTPYRAGWMGAACAIAISGKYVGVAAAIMALVVMIFVCRDHPERNGRRWVAFIASLLVTLSVVNYQLIANIPTFLFGFRSEMADLTRKTKVKDIPHTEKVIRTLVRGVPPAAAIGFATFALYTLVYRRRELVRWMLVLYPIVFVIILAYSPRLFIRHFLPVLTIVNVVAGIGIAIAMRKVLTILRLPENRCAYLLLPLSVGLLTIIYFRDYHKALRTYYNAFSNPTREILIREAIHKLPPDAVIATDRRVFLVDSQGKPRKHLPIQQKVIVASRLAHFGSMEKLRALGVTHIVAHGIDSRYLFKNDRRTPNAEGIVTPAVAGTPPKKPKKKKTKSKYDPALYDELSHNAAFIYAVPGKGSTYNAPALRLYKLPEQ